MAECRSCGAEILWVNTSTYDEREGSDVCVTPKLYRSHFATCPNADEHRK